MTYAAIGCLLFFIQVAFTLPTLQETYDGHQVLQILHNTENDFRKLLDMELKFQLDFWKMPKHVNDTTYVRVAPQHLERFFQELRTLNLDVSTVIENVEEILRESRQKKSLQRRETLGGSSRSSGFDIYSYHTHASIRSYLSILSTASNLPNGITVTLHRLGNTYEGRVMELIKISSSTGGRKRGIFIDGGIHAREWIAPASVIYIIEHLVYNPNGNANINTILSLFDIYILPVVNPDGYEYTNTVRLWRKNRHINSGTLCVGVDLNRNFPYAWNPSIGGSVDPCSDIYSGSSSGSEIETQNLVNFLSNNRALFDAYLTIHSYGQMWLYPWGFTTALPSDWQDLEDAAMFATEQIMKYHGTDYLVGSATRTLYAAAGGSDDYAKGGAGIKYAYTIELRDTGRYGFALPASLIQPVGEELLEGFIQFTLRMLAIESGK